MALEQHIYDEIHHLCLHAWQRGLLSGFNGNVSLRAGEHIAITRSGAAKGYLQKEDVCLIDTEGRIVYRAADYVQPSSEGSMHAQLYQRRSDVQAIIHCHPRHLLALEVQLGTAKREEFLHVPVFEAGLLRDRLGFVKNYVPGSEELAKSVAACGATHDAIWMSQHGLTCIAKSGIEALALAEELEHLAAVQVLAQYPLLNAKNV